MNALEKAIFAAVPKAAKKYGQMTGWWLSHAPESFIQIYVSCLLADEGYSVYPDISVGRIREELELDSKNIADDILRYKCDISVWFKKKRALRASIEIKKSWNSSSILKDIEKIRRINSVSRSASQGYILGYSESKTRTGDSSLAGKFQNWADYSGCKLLDHKIIHDPPIDEVYSAWGFCLIRVT